MRTIITALGEFHYHVQGINTGKYRINKSLQLATRPHGKLKTATQITLNYKDTI